MDENNIKHILNKLPKVRILVVYIEKDQPIKLDNLIINKKKFFSEYVITYVLKYGLKYKSFDDFYNSNDNNNYIHFVIIENTAISNTRLEWTKYYPLDFDKSSLEIFYNTIKKHEEEKLYYFEPTKTLEKGYLEEYEYINMLVEEYQINSFIKKYLSF
jgi:hypothetical protein